MREYDQIAEWYATARDPEVGIPELADFARGLPPHARVLDLGCGNGIPISRFLLQEGFDVVALDSSLEMIERYRAAFPSVPARCGRIQDAHFAAESFDAVVAWGVLFHLSEDDQRAVVRQVSDWLKPGGQFFFTSGDVQGSKQGEMNGVAFHYVSLGADGYRELLERSGMELKTHFNDPGDNHVYVAEKVA
ncbi:MAG: class I SAM-dependent methyltransferase [Acidobacteriota bacterium]|nr:class I SAM-dependent methyltransferase [Acidobacteriota bacterium]